MGCSALLCGRFYDSKESRFQASKRSNMGSAVLQAGRSADIHKFCFQGAKRADMVSGVMKGIYLLIFTDGIFVLETLR